jgi:hypothetical protein
MGIGNATVKKQGESSVQAGYLVEGAMAQAQTMCLWTRMSKVRRKTGPDPSDSGLIRS